MPETYHESSDTQQSWLRAETAMAVCQSGCWLLCDESDTDTNDGAAYRGDAENNDRGECSPAGVACALPNGLRRRNCEPHMREKDAKTSGCDDQKGHDCTQARCERSNTRLLSHGIVQKKQRE